VAMLAERLLKEAACSDKYEARSEGYKTSACQEVADAGSAGGESAVTVLVR
jgi:hypothetical protein